MSVIVVLAMGLAVAQSGSGALKKSNDFYLNYGKETYAKLQMERDIVGLYDYFGEHIVDGVRLYTLSYQDSIYGNRRTGTDSTILSKSNEYQKADFYEKFSNMVITQDAIGGTKTSFLIGDQIATRFTPLTFNMNNFKGIRWDLWTSPFQASFILSRTRPGFLAKKNKDNLGTGESPVTYPVDGAVFDEGRVKYDILGSNFDDTKLSPYGDYDLLWALHGQYNVMDNLDIGVTAINHHVNDVRRGSNPFKGNLPDSLMPNFIHFEFYDGTPMDTLDAGVFVDSVKMYVNGTEVRAKDASALVFRRAFTGDEKNMLIPRDIPLVRPQSASTPVIVEFAIDPKYWEYVDGKQVPNSIRDVKTLKFSYNLAGNYTVFVSTDRQIPVAIGGTMNPQTRRIDYTYPARSVGYIYERGLNIGASAPGDLLNLANNSTTYFGQYITQGARIIGMDRGTFSNACLPDKKTSLMYGDVYKYNYKRYEWTYGLNVSSETYGVNFKGEIAGVNFSGEVALNRSEYMLPGSETSRRSDFKWMGTLKAFRDLSSTLGIGGEAYYVAPQWMTNLDNLQASSYFSRTSYKETDSTGRLKDYMRAARPLGNEWQNIDDNDDDDPFPENSRRHYPSNMNPDDVGKFYADGRIRPNNGEYKSVVLPSGLSMPYDDPNGAVLSKTDKNKDGQPDYIEDFLLFSSDPPVFDLDMDKNNNRMPDVEEDDILPDYGYAVGYIITGDGYRSLGIKGVALDLQYKLTETSTLNFGGRTESVADRDLVLGNGAEEGVLGLDKMDGQSYIGYITARRDVIDRSSGLLYNLGVELRYVRDALRNDYVGNQVWVNQETFTYDVDYRYNTDPLSYRNTAIANAVASVTYNQIRNFEYGFRINGGVEKHLTLLNEDQSPRLFYRPDVVENHWRPYSDRLVGIFNIVNRVQYKMKFNSTYDDWRNMFDFVNNVEIIPQYKFMFFARKEFQGPDETQIDPRDIGKNIALDYNGDGRIDETYDNYGENLKIADLYRSRWQVYQANNRLFLGSVPILRVNYKIAENTALQLGSQWLRYFDLVSPENNFLSYTFLGQIVSKANYKGFSVTLFLGGMWQDYIDDITAADPVTGNGWNYRVSGYTFFARLFSGI